MINRAAPGTRFAIASIACTSVFAVGFAFGLNRVGTIGALMSPLGFLIGLCGLCGLFASPSRTSEWNLSLLGMILNAGIIALTIWWIADHGLC